MTAVVVPAYALPPIRPHKWIRNGKYPDAQLAKELADAVNQGAYVRGKEHCRFSTPLYPELSAGSSRTRWRCVFRTSPHARYLAASIGIAPGTTSGGVTITLYDETTTEVASAVVTTSAGTGSMVPNAWIDTEPLFLDGSGDLFEPDPYTLYFATFVDDDCTLLWGTIYEWAAIDATTENGFALANYAASSPVLDEDREAVAQLGSLLWRQQGSHIFSFSVDIDADRLNDNATYEVPPDEKNLVTNSSADLDEGRFLIDLSNRARVSEAGTVKVMFWACGAVIGGSGSIAMQIRLRDSSGTALSTLSFTGAASWQSEEIELPAGADSYHVTYQTTGTGTWSGDGYAYAAGLITDDDR